MIHPLELPEIRARIAAYLNTRDAINCVRVSKDWNSTFSEIIWNHISLGIANSSPSRLLPTIGQIQAHSSHIRAMSLRDNLPDDYYLLDNLHRLYSLQVEHRFHSSDRILPFLGKLIENHSSSLEQFQLTGWRSLVSRSTFNALGMCQHLNSISLIDVLLTSEDLRVLLINCASIGSGAEHGQDNDGQPRSGHGGLGALLLDDVKIQEYNESDVSTLAPLSYLEYLTVKSSPGILADGLIIFFMLCPNVKSFHWSATLRFEAVEWVVNIESGMWSSLTCLHLVGAGFGDIELSRVIKSLLSPLEKLLVEMTGFGRAAFNSLITSERHYNNLKELDLSGCWDVTSGMIQQIMTKMPSLESLTADYLCVTDILDTSHMDRNGEDNGQEWISNNIRTLRLCINLGGEFDPSSQEYCERQRHVYRRLSNLKLVEILEVGRNFFDKSRSVNVQRMDSQPSSGLGYLLSLKRLKEFSCNRGECLKMKDIELRMRQ